MNFELESPSIDTLTDLVGYGGLDEGCGFGVSFLSSYRERICCTIACHVGPAAELSVLRDLSRRIVSRGCVS